MDISPFRHDRSKTMFVQPESECTVAIGYKRAKNEAKDNHLIFMAVVRVSQTIDATILN